MACSRFSSAVRQGARAAKNSRRVAVSLSVSFLSIASIGGLAAAPAHAASGVTVCSPNAIALTNAGFESPAIPARSYRIMSEQNVPGWSTTARDKQIELWSSGFGNVIPAEGKQFAELNANMASALFQDVETTPGTAMTWSLAHRGREGVDTMRVMIGPADGTLKEVARMSNGTSAWGRHSGAYVVPAGQSVTRFAFEAVSTAGGNPTVGNFLDDITFGTPACIVLTKSAQLLGDAAPGSKVRWNITATNRGGGPAENLVIKDSLPMHSTYVAGSLRLATGPRAGSLTDASDSDAGTFASNAAAWKPIGGSNIAGRLNPGESTTVSFDTIIKTSGAGAKITNTASATYTADGSAEESSSNLAVVDVAEIADVFITKLFDAATVQATAGTAAANFTLVVGNNGPFAADDVKVVDPLPTGLTVDIGGLTISDGTSGSTCRVTTRLWTGTTGSGSQDLLDCSLGTLPKGAIRIITVPATFTKTTPGVVTVPNEASVTTSTVDVNPTNDASASEMVFDPGVAADVAVNVTATNTEAARPGEQIGWLLNVFNATEVGLTATGVTVTAPIPADMTDVVVPAGCAVASETITCTIGSLEAGGRRQLLITGKVVETAVDAAKLTLAATVSADAGSNSDPSNDNDSASITVIRPAELEIAKRALDPVTQAQTRFVVTVTSVGPFEARNVVLMDTFSNATVVSAPDSCDTTVEPIVCTLGTLDVGQSVTLNFTFQSLSVGSEIKNAAAAKADNAQEVSARVAALRIIPEYGETPLPGGLPAAPEPPSLARTGGVPIDNGAAALMLLTGGAVLLVTRRRMRG